MIFMPPRHGKSEMTTVRYPVYRMELDPSIRVCVWAYNQEFANKFGRKTRRLASTRFRLADDRTAAREWETPQGGVYRSVGVGSPPTGEGFNLILGDDPIKSRIEAESLTFRDNVYESFNDDLMTRAEPGAAVILTMTRWHEDDLAGRILKGPSGSDWEVISLPAIAEEDDLLGRAIGEALCPNRYDLQALLAIKKGSTQYAFDALFQQRPSAREGSFFRVARLEIVDALPAGIDLVRAWDKAATAGAGDYTAGVLMGEHEGIYYVADVRRFREDSGTRDKIIRQTAMLDGTDVSVVGEQEPGSSGKDSAGAFIKLLAGFNVHTEPATGKKEVRADTFAAQVNAGNVRLVRGDWNLQYIEELRQFQAKAEHDDQVDASSLAFSNLSHTIEWESF